MRSDAAVESRAAAQGCCLKFGPRRLTERDQKFEIGSIDLSRLAVVACFTVEQNNGHEQTKKCTICSKQRQKHA